MVILTGTIANIEACGKMIPSVQMSQSVTHTQTGLCEQNVTEAEIYRIKSCLYRLNLNNKNLRNIWPILNCKWFRHMVKSRMTRPLTWRSETYFQWQKNWWIDDNINFTYKMAIFFYSQTCINDHFRTQLWCREVPLYPQVEFNVPSHILRWKKKKCFCKYKNCKCSN